jgi:hypothetical protein
MDVEARLRKLEEKYRRALSGAVAAKARFLALNEGSHTQRARDMAKHAWLRVDARRQVLARSLWSLQFSLSDRAGIQAQAQRAAIHFQAAAEPSCETPSAQAAFHFV